MPAGHPMIRITRKLFKRVQRSFLWIWRQDGTPAKRARGVAVGVFSGCFPFFGLQTFLGISLASLFRGNHLLAATGTWISNPLTYFPLYWFNYKIGTIVLGESSQIHNFRELLQRDLLNQGWIISSRMLLGSSIVGVLSGLIMGFIAYILFKSLSKEKN